MVFNIGSIQVDTYSFFDPFPTALSGTAHYNLIKRKLVLLENYLQKSIGSENIDDKYYQVLYDTTIASVLGYLQVNDSSNASSVSLGDFSFGDKVGGGTDVEKAKSYFETQAKDGMDALKFMSYEAMVYKSY